MLTEKFVSGGMKGSITIVSVLQCKFKETKYAQTDKNSLLIFCRCCSCLS